MKATSGICLMLGICGVLAYPGIFRGGLDPYQAAFAATTWKNPTASGDLAAGKPKNLPKSGHQVRCETRPHSNDDIINTISYAHNLYKSNSPTKIPENPSNPKSKYLAYPHHTTFRATRTNTITNADFELTRCNPENKNFIEYPILADGTLWMNGISDPGPDRILFQYINETTAAYCGTVYHPVTGKGRPSNLELCTNSHGGNL